MSNKKIIRMKGFVFTIDATLALFLLVLSLITITFLSIQGQDNPYPRVGIARAGKDTLAVLDHQGVLLSWNSATISSELNSTLPVGVAAHLQVYTYYYDNGAFDLINVSDYGPPPPNNSSTYGARLDFVGMRGNVVTNYSIARMTIWQK